MRMRPPSSATTTDESLRLQTLVLLVITALFIPCLAQPQTSLVTPSSHHPPPPSQINSPPSVFRIVEELPPGTFVGNMRENHDLLTSHRQSVLLQLQFSFRHSGSAFPLFFIDQSTGIIKTSKRIDRDLLCPRLPNCSLSLDVIVRPTQYFRILRVVVEVEDINDNSPVFPQTNFTLDVNENRPVGTRFPLPSAVDDDSRFFGVQTYTAIHSSSDSEAKFQLSVSEHEDGTKPLMLLLRDRLDRESCDAYVITVIAFDAGSPPKSASMVVSVSISDANDNSPLFESTSYEVTVSESRAPNLSSPLVTVHATDPDLGKNGEVRYSFADYTEADYGRVFSIDFVGGDILLRSKVDYERQRAYVLTVVASDLGTGSLSSFAKVSVLVVDENDNQPRISLNSLTESGLVAVPENSAAGTLVALLTVEDSDSGENARVVCSVDDDAILFRLEHSHGTEFRLTTLKPLDREEESEYVVTVTCKDKGQPPFTVYKAIEVEVLDENDNAPVLAPEMGDPIVIEVDENKEPATEIGQVKVTDRDVGPNAELRYILIPDDAESKQVLGIDPITGQLYTNTTLDFETRTDYMFQLRVADLGDPPKSTATSLVLRIRDSNDETPRFDKPAYYFIVLENLPPGSPVGSVRATDNDRTARFSQILFRLSDARLPFHVDPDTGALTTARKLDREETMIFRFAVIGQNPEPFAHIRSIVNVTVYVDDDNDNPPIIRFPSKTNNVVQIPSNARNGSLVVRVDAWDPDDGRNGQVCYAITHGNDDVMFSVDEETGAIVTNGDVRTHSRGSYNLVVVVRDRGTPALFSVRDLVIRINGSASTDGGGHSTSAQQDIDAKKSNDRLMIIVGMLVAFFFVMLLLGLCVLLSLIHQRRAKRRKDKQAVIEAELAASDAERTESDAEGGRRSAGLSGSGIVGSQERCSNRDCPFASKVDLGCVHVAVGGNESENTPAGKSHDHKRQPVKVFYS